MAPDPLDALYQPAAPLAPDAGFAAELPRRIRTELDPPPPEGAAMTATETASTAAFAPRQERALTPYIAVRDARRAIDWYIDVFGARPVSEPIVMDDGRIGHAELDLGGSLLMLSEEFPEMGVVSPLSQEGSSVSFVVHVPDIDATWPRALAAGAREERPVSEQYGSRSGWLVDPFGHRWSVGTPLDAEPLGGDPGTGELCYFWIGTRDVEAAKAFYGALLGWEFSPGHAPQGWNITNSTLPCGLNGGQAEPHVRVYLSVPDADAAVARVTELGGEVVEAPTDEPFGRPAELRDDQGRPFGVIELAPHEPSASAPTGGSPGYVTLGRPDGDRAAAFFGSLLGWGLEGEEPGSYHVDGIDPPAGINQDDDAVVLYFRVDDIAAAARVQDLGGDATEPVLWPSGWNSTCHDDQGLRFDLWQPAEGY